LNVSIDTVANALSAELSGDGSPLATDVTHDSRQARPGTLFVAIKGLTMDGHRFIDDVRTSGFLQNPNRRSPSTTVTIRPYNPCARPNSKPGLMGRFAARFVLCEG